MRATNKMEKKEDDWIYLQDEYFIEQKGRDFKIPLRVWTHKDTGELKLFAQKIVEKVGALNIDKTINLPNKGDK